MLFTNHDVPTGTNTVNFMDQAALGHAYPRREVQCEPELRYMHISNAGLATPNPGINTVQVRLGVGKFLGRQALRRPLCSSVPAVVNRLRSFQALRHDSSASYSSSVMSTLVECVPNFSEGRDKAKVDAIVDAMKMPGVYLLDREMDADHNRCVITLVGEREAIQEAAIRGVGKAAELIDLNIHTGAHPRMGAADVVPFIPIDGVTIEDCVAMANHVGEEIWKRYQIPVYLYEAAARIPERQGLENIRRGQFEGIRAEIATNPARRPDIGDPRVHPTAGATVVGARKFLIAYNVFLNTPDVDIAKKIAKAVRFSSGGMRFVKGAGFLVRGLAQVSMNLTDFEQTPIHRVFEMVKREAARYGVTPVSSEIVGPDSQESLGAGGRMVPASGELRFVADSRKSAGRGDGRENGSRRPARRSRAVRRATRRSHGDSRRRQRLGRRRSHGGGPRVDGRLHVARQEGLSAV